MAQRSFIVVGAGLGGLATALRLAHRGHRVTVLEKTSEIGGRNKPLTIGRCRFDMGPTLLMMRDPFERLFRDVGEDFEAHLCPTLCDPSYRTCFADGTRIDGTPNVARMVEQLRALGLERDAAAYPRLLGDIGDLYADAVPNFVRRNYDGPLGLASPRALRLVTKHRMLANLWERTGHYMTDERLRTLFSFQTMYLGLSPFDAPWVYAVLTYMEYGEGIWYPTGGLAQVCRTVADLAIERGAVVRTGCPVTKIESGTVTLESGETLTADAVVCNADLPYAQRRLAPRPTKPMRTSCSAFLIYADVDDPTPGLLHHNVFFGQDYRGNLEALFRSPLRVPEDPAFYVCASNKTDPTVAPPGATNLMALVPCPNLDRPMSEAEEAGLVAHVWERLRREVGFDPSTIRTFKTYGPKDWEADLNLDRGAAFGLSHDFLQSVCFRPSNRDRRDRKLFYVGASTVPGNGLPMVLISAELVERRLEEAGLA